VEFVARISTAVARFRAALDHLDTLRTELEGLKGDLPEKAEFCRSQILPAMGEARASGDILEGLVDDSLWPLPKYREMLFIE